MNSRLRYLETALFGLLFAAAMLLAQRYVLAHSSPNLLINPSFDSGDLYGWQTATSHGAFAPEASTVGGFQEDAILFAIEDTPQIAVSGITQEIAVQPRLRHRINLDFRLLEKNFSSSDLSFRIVEFDREGRESGSIEFASSTPLTMGQEDPDERPEWSHSSQHVSFGANTVAIRFGVGLAGTEATRVYVTRISLKPSPTFRQLMVEDGAACTSTVLVVGLGCLLFVLYLYLWRQRQLRASIIHYPAVRAVTFMRQHWRWLLVLLLLAAAACSRLQRFDEFGWDYSEHKRAVTDLLAGRNPYEYTVRSFAIPDNLDLGYAYLPLYLYLNTIAYWVSHAVAIPLRWVWKIPVLLSDIVVGLLIVRQLHSERKDYPAAIAGICVWLFNPYWMVVNVYTSFDPLPVAFLLAAVILLGKRDSLSGFFYGLGIATKTFPIFLLPIFIYKAAKPIRLIAATSLVVIAVSLPFLRDFDTFVRGAFLVHGERGVAGRPLWPFLLNLFGLKPFESVQTEILAILSVSLGWVFLGVFWFSKRDRLARHSLPVLSLASIGFYYLLTPVLNRSHIMWFLPVLILGLYDLALQKGKKHIYYYGLLIYWLFFTVYLSGWHCIYSLPQ